MRDELAALREQNARGAMLRTENDRLSRIASEVGELRRQGTELARLSAEADALRQRRQEEIESAKKAEARKLATRDVLPVARVQPPAAYPPALLAERVSGRVNIDFLVDGTGRVQNAFVTKSTQREFEEPALEAVKRWGFDAGLKNGRSVITHMVVPIAFDPEKGVGAPDEPAMPAEPPKSVDLLKPNWF